MPVLSIDTGDLDIVEQFAATGYITDATTNPLFVSQAGLSGEPRYVAFVEEAITYAKEKMCNMDGCDVDDAIALAMDRLAVNLGKNILSLGIKGALLVTRNLSCGMKLREVPHVRVLQDMSARKWTQGCRLTRRRA